MTERSVLAISNRQETRLLSSFTQDSRRVFPTGMSDRNASDRLLRQYFATACKWQSLVEFRKRNLELVSLIYEKNCAIIIKYDATKQGSFVKP